jgi:hypothetical protein
MRGVFLVPLASFASFAVAGLGLAACGSSDPSEASSEGEGGAPASDGGPPGSDGSLGAPIDGGGSGPDATLGDGGASGSPPCPALSALVEADSGRVCVDLYEGAIVVPSDDGGGESAWPWYLPVDDLDAGFYRAVPAQGTFPQGYISQVQATAACNASGKRLCTFTEWTAACRGQPAHDYVYPYGDTYEAGRCNEGHESPIVELFGPDPSYDNAELNDPRCDQLEGGLARGGAYGGCESTYGAFDMHGNIHEWIDQTNASGTGSFMGGYFVDATLNGPGCEYQTTAHEKTYHDYSTGFRCCADPSANATSDE